MKQSKLFGKTLREAPKDAEAVSHIYLTRGGFVKQLSSGLFSFLPLGFKVLKKIVDKIKVRSKDHTQNLLPESSSRLKRAAFFLENFIK